MLRGTCYEEKRSHSFDVTHYEEVGDHVTILILDVSPLYNNGHTCQENGENHHKQHFLWKNEDFIEAGTRPLNEQEILDDRCHVGT